MTDYDHYTLGYRRGIKLNKSLDKIATLLKETEDENLIVFWYPSSENQDDCLQKANCFVSWIFCAC